MLENNTYRYSYDRKKYFKVTKFEYSRYQFQNRKVTFSTFSFENAWISKALDGKITLTVNFQIDIYNFLREASKILFVW